MPLIPGSPVGKSISELIDSYKAKGTIGNIRPKSAKKAREIAAAIAYRVKGESK